MGKENLFLRGPSERHHRSRAPRRAPPWSSPVHVRPAAPPRRRAAERERELRLPAARVHPSRPEAELGADAGLLGERGVDPLLAL